MNFVNAFTEAIFKQKYSYDGQEDWTAMTHRVVNAVCGNLIKEETKNEIKRVIEERKFIPGGRYLYSAGRPYHNVNNCFLFRADDSREGWGDLVRKAMISLMSGGGIGVDYSRIRPSGTRLARSGGTSTGPIALMQCINELGRNVIQGGQRRSAIWAGLMWNHPDILSFINLKNHSKALRAAKKKDINFPLPMELTNISVIYDTRFFDNPDYKIWGLNCHQAFSTAEPGFSFNYYRDLETLRNACTEVTSEDDSDKCNLGTVWLNHAEGYDDFCKTVRLATTFLMCGGLYSDVPTEKIRETGDRNNRIGLGLGGFHEWLMVRGSEYEVTDELRTWLEKYQSISDETACLVARELGVVYPKGRRAIAPNGTIGILAETTTGIEPLYCKAYKRRYVRKGNMNSYQYVVDGTVKRLLDKGIPLEAIKDSSDISFEDRVRFQADVQDYVDMAISSTCNLPPWGTDKNNKNSGYDAVLLKYAKRLRGFTCYPDGCRDGQPIERCELDHALNNEGRIFENKMSECVGGVCGI